VCHLYIYLPLGVGKTAQAQSTENGSQNMTDKNGLKTAHRDHKGRFTEGNTGKPRGSKHKITKQAEALLDGEAQALTRKAIEKALDGDSMALRLCLDRIAPPRKDRLIGFDLPALASIQDSTQAAARVIQSVAEGEITPNEANTVMQLVEAFTRMAERCDLETRLEALEAQIEGVKP